MDKVGKWGKTHFRGSYPTSSGVPHLRGGAPDPNNPLRLRLKTFL